MRSRSIGKHYLLTIFVLSTLFSACGENGSASQGAGMFGFFKSKKIATIVSPHVGFALQKQSSMAANLSLEAVQSFPKCQTTNLRGYPPDGQWSTDQVSGETQPVYLIPAYNGHPDIAILVNARNQMQMYRRTGSYTAILSSSSLGKIGLSAIRDRRMRSR